MKKLMMITAALLIGVAPVQAGNKITAQYPWMGKAQWDLTRAECAGAMRHDAYYWWGRDNKCHMREIRYATGVVIRDTVSQFSDPDATPDPDTPVTKKGELLVGIVTYDEKSQSYCITHGGGCYPARDVMLLGSALTGPYNAEDSDPTLQGVETSCDLMLADRANIIKANGEKILEGCR
jgi:hypothetical protein